MKAGGTIGQLQQDRGNPRLKFLDRYAGIPVIEALGLARRVTGRRAVPPDWRTIGLVKTVGIGDIVLLSAVIRDLREARPDARIVLFVSANNLGFARLLDGVDAVIPVPVRDIVKAVRIVRAEGCDVVVDFGAWPRFESLLTALSGAQATVGMRTPGQHRDAAYDVVIDHETGHEIDNYRRLIAAIGVSSRRTPSFPAGCAPRPLEAPYAGLHLWPGGANFAERSWSEDRWRSVARALNERGLDVVLTGGPGDLEPTEMLVARWHAEGIRAHAVAGLSPEDTVMWLRHAAGLVSVNTGVMHLGAALGVPVVVLNGPTSGRRWGPLGAPSRSVASPMVPEGYLNLGWERDDRYRNCMASITVDAVVSAWDDLMAGLADTPPRFGVV